MGMIHIFTFMKQDIIKIKVVIKSKKSARKGVFSLTIFNFYTYSNKIKYV